MKSQVSKPPKVALCRMCHGTGTVPAESKTERSVKTFLRGFRGAEPVKTKVCPQCGGSGRVTVSASIEYEIRPYNPDNG